MDVVYLVHTSRILFVERHEYSGYVEEPKFFF